MTRKPDVGQIFRSSAVVLLSGPIETRLAHEFGLPSPGKASFMQLFSEAGRAALGAIYESYIQVAIDHALPIVVDTPTWRANPNGLAEQGLTAADDLRRVNAEAVAFIQSIRTRLRADDRVIVAGVIGPRGDGYDPSGAPDVAAACLYHAPQARVLAEAGVDMLYAPTVPSAAELEGMALAMARPGLPYVLAPVITRHGVLPDGCPLAELVRRVDAAARPAPLLIAGGCIHSADFTAAVSGRSEAVHRRVRGIAANGSGLPRADLVKLDHDESDDPPTFGRALLDLHRNGAQLLGGCCGTSDAHLRAFAELVGRTRRQAS